MYALFDLPEAEAAAPGTHTWWCEASFPERMRCHGTCMPVCPSAEGPGIRSTIHPFCSLGSAGNLPNGQCPVVTTVSIQSDKGVLA